MVTRFWNFSGKRFLITILTALAVLMIASGVLLYLTATGSISAPVASLAATMMLVFLTGFYATVTYWMALETKKAREQEIRPVLDFHSREIYSEIVNQGGGPARNIDITLTLLPAGESHRVQQQSLPSGESVSIPVEPFFSMADRGFLDLQLQGLDVDWTELNDETDVWEVYDYPFEQLRMEGSCEDIWENTYGIEQEYQVWDLTHGKKGTVSPTLDEEDSLHKAAMELEGIRGLLEEVVRSRE